ncbi:tRNA 4-thiouridine(8) synthase ThiI [Fusibacter paucivorans]|uniref:Probable tRNA sulfurtransferase n=1 Tax=Fusibacter paucivorans TaxID=76009 RepID=A0ABS5PVJ7_9FIRM|nr:tRNA uracil 4-sulfurtransferase ThiI [Fusibacter paucivorans]MBS7528546.1 tRNA 4-thiouridine(8) synthase ThiI [Fusibacter paucivorans]
METLLLVRYGELALKGNNRRFFEKKLIKSVQRSLSQIESAKVLDQHGRLFIASSEEDQQAVIKAVTRIFGIVSVSVAKCIKNDFEQMKTEGLAEIQHLMTTKGIKTFKVEARRSNKGFHMTSPEICKNIGAYILSQTNGALSVDVHHPDCTLQFEIRDKTYIFSDRIAGPGGLPLGSAGRGMLLLSGGIDSPVAGYQMAKRGVELEAVHFHSYPFTSERALEKVLDLGKTLTRYTQHLKIHSINLLEIQQSIAEHCPEEEMTILSRRFMMRIAEKISEKNRCQCLITGENIGQVASQTMEGLTATNASVSLPILRPLIAYDKLDIIDVAKKIETFETSILPFEDCCTVFLPDKVVTKPKVEKLEYSESKLAVEALIDRAVESEETFIIVWEKIAKDPREVNE